MTKRTEHGSVHIVIIVILTLIIICLVGYLFWQNVLNKKYSSVDSSATSQATTTPSTTPVVDLVTTAKTGIASSMNTDGYKGLENYMAISVDGGIAYSDGIYKDQTSAVVANSIRQYFESYATNNKTTIASGWKFEEFDTTTNAKVIKTASDANKAYFDFAGSYVGVTTSPNGNLFIAFKLDAKGKIVNTLYGSML